MMTLGLINCGKARVSGLVPGILINWQAEQVNQWRYGQREGWMWRVFRRLGGEIFGVGSLVL